LQSKRNGKKSGAVTGSVQLQFTLIDPLNSTATPQQILQKFGVICGANSSPDADEAEDERLERIESGEHDDDDEDQEEITDEADEGKTPEVAAEKKKKRLRLARLKKKVKERGYEFSGATDVAGVLFVEIQRITDLPPEKNGMFMASCNRFAKLTESSSSSYWLRYGSFRGHFSWQEDIPYPCSSSQPQSCIRREAGLPGHET
jgi:hypothetical protein